MRSQVKSQGSVRTIALFTAAILSLAALVLSGCGGPEVPDVVGMGQADAVRALQDAGYLLGDINSVYSSNVPVGTVASTKPPAGTAAKEGTKVDISINMGVGAEVTVPAVTGIEQKAAEEQLSRIDLVPLAVQSYSETITAGVVMAQVPAASSVVSAGSTVIIQVSSGTAPKAVAVPNVVGKTADAATSAIKAAGLKAQVHEAYSSSVAKGNVIGQSPEAGASVAPGSEVAIAVSLGKGVGAVTVPNVVGKSEADATSAMNSAGLKPRVYRQNSDTVAAGVVSNQLPAAGTTTGSGSEVAIVVSLGKAAATGNVSVPDVVGTTEAEAKTSLESIGLIVQVVPQSDEAPPGTVVAQFPFAGSTVPVGSQAAIVVSKEP